MKLMPAPAGHGIRFRRTDLPGAPEVEALAENVSNTARSTTISRGEAVAVTIEHIMSALTGLGVDNALIDLDNGEAEITAAEAVKDIAPGWIPDEYNTFWGLMLFAKAAVPAIKLRNA